MNSGPGQTVEEDNQLPVARTVGWNTSNKGPNDDDDGGCSHVGDSDDEVEGTAEGITEGDDEDDEAEGTPQHDGCSQGTLGGMVGHPLLDAQGLYRMSLTEGPMHDLQVCTHSGQCVFS